MAVWKWLYDISESDRHASCSFEAVGVWAYLLGSTDSCGRRSVDWTLLKAKVFTLRAEATEEWVSGRLAELSESGLVHPYEVGGRRYIVLHQYAKYNAGALLKSRPNYPPPPEELCDCLNFHESERLRSVMEPEKGVKTPLSYPVLSSPVLSGGKEEMQEKPSGGFPEIHIEPGNLGYLQKVAYDMNIIGARSTINTAVAGWRTRYGSEKCLEMLMNNGGKTVMEIDRLYAPQPEKPKKPSNECKHGKSLMYGISCRKCDEESK